MPLLAANDGVNLHYDTFGLNNNPPLILVSARISPTIANSFSFEDWSNAILKQPSSYMDSQARFKSSSVMSMHFLKTTMSLYQISVAMATPTSPKPAITLHV